MNIHCNLLNGNKLENKLAKLARVGGSALVAVEGPSTVDRPCGLPKGAAKRLVGIYAVGQYGDKDDYFPAACTLKSSAGQQT